MRLRVVIGMILLALGPGAAAALARARGDVSVLAQVPSPGYPALPHVVGSDIYEGTYSNPAGDNLPSKVFEFSPALPGTRSPDGARECFT